MGALSSVRALAGSCVYVAQRKGGADGWVSLDASARRCSSSFFLSCFCPDPEHSGKPFVLRCSVVELDQRIPHGLCSVPEAFPKPIFPNSQH